MQKKGNPGGERSLPIKKNTLSRISRRKRTSPQEGLVARQSWTHPASSFCAVLSFKKISLSVYPCSTGSTTAINCQEKWICCLRLSYAKSWCCDSYHYVFHEFIYVCDVSLPEMLHQAPRAPHPSQEWAELVEVRSGCVGQWAVWGCLSMSTGCLLFVMLCWRDRIYIGEIK